jgi:MipA family protein
MNNVPLTLILFLCALLATPAQAAPPCEAASTECVVVGKWDVSVGLGVGERTNPVRGGSDIPLLILPQISYYGERFFLENLEFGLTLHEDEVHTLNLISTPGYDRVFFDRHDLQNALVTPFKGGGDGGVGRASDLGGDGRHAEVDTPALKEATPRRHTTYLVGPEWIVQTGRFIGQLDALYEVTGRHDGYEVRAALATSLLQSHGSLVMSGGLTWKSAQLVGYYYGIEGLYDPGSATNPFFKLAYTLPLSERWTARAFAHYEYLDESIADSPLIGASAVTTFFAGVVFKIF